MHERSALGAADVTDAELTVMVAADRDVDAGRVTLLSSSVEEVDYDLPAITTWPGALRLATVSLPPCSRRAAATFSASPGLTPIRAAMPLGSTSAASAIARPRSATSARPVR